MLTKLRKSRQMQRFSLFLVLIFTCTFLLPLNSPTVMAASEGVVSGSEINPSVINNEIGLSLPLSVEVDNTELQVEISDGSLLPTGDTITNLDIETPIGTSEKAVQSDLLDNDLNLDQEIKAEEELMHSSLAVDFSGGTGTEQDPYLVSTEAQLDNVRNNLDKYFKQTGAITLKVSTWNAGKGWAPIGADGTEFTGSYDGNGFAINKLYINRPDEDNIGLFGILGDGAKLSNIAMEGAIVIGKGNVGGLTGKTVADEANAVPTKVEINNCRISGNVSGKGDVGGLIGANYATAGQISNCFSTTTVSGQGWTGGLVGVNQGPIKNTYTTGTVVGTEGVGGLVGLNQFGSASISDSHTSGGVNGSSNSVGGLVGYNTEGVIENSYASGAINATNKVGGLVGYNKNGLITQTFATGTVMGNYGSIGGLVGYNESGQITESYSSGNVERTNGSSNDTSGGGLIGTNYGTALVSECYATGSVNLTSGSYNYAGGLIGYNYYNTGISIRDCYAIGKVTVSQYYSVAGGLIGSREYDKSIISGAYYDKTTTGQSDTTKGSVPKATAEMKQQATFSGWDFANTWTINEGSSYPDLQWKTASNGGVKGVSLNKSILSLTVGGAPTTLIATVSPADTMDKSVTWKSDNLAVATVDANGLVKPVGAGMAKITVSTVDGNKPAICTVTVTAAAVNLSEFLASPTSLSLLPGRTGSITLTAKYSSGASETVTSDKASWISDKTAIVTVVNGTVTAVAKGQATITVTFSGKSSSIAVTVSEVSPATEIFSKTYKFSDLVSNTAEFNSVLSSYTSRELKVVVPDKYLKKISSTHTPNILTNFTVETGSQVRKVKVQCGTDIRDADRIESTKFNCDWAGLSKGAEVIIIAYDASSNELERKVLRLKEGTNIISQDLGSISPGNYALLDLISNTELFNAILNVFSMADLNVGVPVRYITNIDVQHTVYTTTFTITTAGSVDKVTVLTNGQELDTQSQGGGIFKRDISGLNSGDSVTVRAYDQSGRLLYEKPAFVD